jgi:NAD(P)-dependent dehydrogenase (short-subunit alcohol dehydrogenase family)
MAQAQSRAAGEKVALITGASGGIGLAAGVALIRAGYRVFGTSRHAAPGEARQGIHMLRSGRLRLIRRVVPEKIFEKSLRKQMGVVD